MAEDGRNLRMDTLDISEILIQNVLIKKLKTIALCFSVLMLN